MWILTNHRRAQSVIFGLCVTALSLAFAPMAQAKRGRVSKGAVALKCSIKGADVWLDGKKLGQTPMEEFALPVGRHKLVVKKLGYLEFAEQVNIKRGKTLKVRVELLPFAGVIHVTSAVPGAQVFVDGRKVGTAPLSYEVKIGSREIKVIAKGKPHHVEKIKAGAGRTYEIKATFGAAMDDGLGDLALVPLEPLPAETDDELALEPPPPDGDDGALDLVALPDSGPAGGGQGGDDDLLALEPLQLEPVGPTGVSKNAEPLPPWWQRWYTIAGAATAVTVIAIVVRSKVGSGEGGDEGDVASLGRWKPGESWDESAVSLGIVLPMGR